MRVEIITFTKKLLLSVALGGALYAALLYCSEQERGRDISIFQLEATKKRLHRDTYWPRIIMGDSRTLALNYSYTGAALEGNERGERKERIYNFSFSNTGGIYPYVYFLHKYLEKHPAPKEILWAFIPLMLTDTWEVFKRPVPVAVNAAEIYRSARLYALEDILFPMADATAVFWHYPATTKAIVKAKLSIDPESVLRFFTSTAPTEDFNGLYNSTTGALLFAREARWQYSPDNYLEQTEFVISPQSVEFVRQFLTLAHRHGIQVTCFNMPIPEPIYAKRRDSGFYAQYFAVLEQMQQEFPETFSFTTAVPAFPNEYFSDGSHLNEAGARKMGEIVKAGEAGVRF